MGTEKEIDTVVAGIDSGAENTKAVILAGHSTASAMVLGGKDTTISTATLAIDEAAQKAGIQRSHIECIVATGSERNNVAFANFRVPDYFCLAKGIHQAAPSVRTMVDIGAEKVLVVKCCQGTPLATANNDQCASGTGIMLNNIAGLLGIPIEEAGKLSLSSKKNIEVVNTCAVFIESDVISLIHTGESCQDILRGVFRGMASRICTLILRLGLEQDIAIVGGVARNVGVVHAFNELLKCKAVVPSEPHLLGAYGAALIARERRGEPR